MNNLEKIATEISDLVKLGSKILEDGQKEDVELGSLAPRYEIWYTKALSVVSQIIPERLPEFKEAYRHEKRKDVKYDTYAVSDFLLGLRVSRGGTPTFSTTMAFGVKMMRQVGILASAAESAKSILHDIRYTLRSELLDSDIHAAKNLLKAGHLRSAGIVCGVVIETHLAAVCERHQIKIAKKDPGIGEFNDLLKSGNVYDVSMWRLIQRLGDIRNLCGHRKERDPKKDEVEDLISGTEKVTKEII